MWICVWAGSDAQGEIQPAAFRPAQEYCSLSSSRLGSSQQREMVLQTCFVTLLGLDNWGKEEDSHILGLGKRASPMEGLLRDKGAKMLLCRGTAQASRRGVQKDPEKCLLPGRRRWL